jgi:hypothetical protein
VTTSTEPAPDKASDLQAPRPSRRPSPLVFGLGALALIGLGGGLLAWLQPRSHPSRPAANHNTVAATSTDNANQPITIDVQHAEPATCPTPISPGKGHADPVLTMTLHVIDNKHNRYLLGWQIVPYRGPRTYTLDQKGGALLALEPATTGTPLGFGTGTLTVAANSTNGSIDATVPLIGGGTARIAGRWQCTPGPGH